MTRTGLQLHLLPPSDALVDQWAKLRTAIIGRRTNWKDPARQLYKLLIYPAEEAIIGKRLVIVPDGVLDFVPFELLLTEEPTMSPETKSFGRSQLQELGQTYGDSSVVPHWKQSGDNAPAAFLINRHAVIYSPSAAYLAAVRRRTATARGTVWPQDFIGFAPIEFHSAARLPGTEDEVRGIARLFPVGRATVYIGVHTTKLAVCTAGLRQYRFIHFATHGQADQQRPELCGLLFPNADQDDLLQTAEVFQLDLTADLVAASACVTGLGRQVDGEGVVGLKRGFLRAGAKSVCVSLWSVADDPTAELMTRFYRHLIVDCLDKAEALRRAKRELIEEGRWTEPFFWAPFVLSGDWR